MLAGEGEDFKKINKFIELNNLQNNIFLIGFINDPKTFIFLNLKDLFLHLFAGRSWICSY